MTENITTEVPEDFALECFFDSGTGITWFVIDGEDADD
jgi:hypothetical protein